LELDRTLQFEADLQEKIQNLTTDDIRAALREVLGDAKMVELMAGDFSKADEEQTEAATPGDDAAADASQRKPRRDRSGAGAR
jgi:hypothetical protein